MNSLTSKTFLLPVLILPLFTTISIGCCPKLPPVQTVIRVPTSCLETVGLRPVMKKAIDTRPENCPPEMACLDIDSQRVLSRFISQTLLWMDQVEIACNISEETDE